MPAVVVQIQVPISTANYLKDLNNLLGGFKVMLLREILLLSQVMETKPVES